MSVPDLPADAALFLDYDGTLVGFHDDPDQVHLADGQKDWLRQFCPRVDGALGIISGRDVRDLSTRVPDNLWRAGNHGLAIAAPGEVVADLPAAPVALRRAVDDLVAGLEGAWVETKGPVLAIHTRNAEGPARQRLSARLRPEIEPETHDYLIEEGKDVVELKPKEASKGAAIARLMADAPFAGRTPVFLGDDTTDEAGFAEVIERGGLAIKVGPGDSCAPHRLASPEAVWDWLTKGTP